MIFPDIQMEANHELYLAILLSKEQGKTVAKILQLGHRRPDPGHEDLAHPARPPPDHLWVRDSLGVWLGTRGCKREGLPMWKLRRRRGTVRISRTQSTPNQTSPSCRRQKFQVHGACCRGGGEVEEEREGPVSP